MISPSTLTIRLSDGDGEDRERIRRLAALGAAPAPDGLVLVADLDGEAVAAIGFAEGEPVADPARSDGGILSLLRAYRWAIRSVAVVWGA
jgi:hypothetical protein